MMESPGVSPAPRSADDRKATHIFTELRSHDDLLLPVRGSKRLKYTCITCSRQYIALGASHGGLYIFQRDTLKYLQQIGNKERLTKALFSPNENVVGMATSGGAVIVWNLNIRSRQKPERIAATKAHWNRQITSLCWDDTGLRLFSGDERGRITVTNTDSSKPSGIFKFQSEQVTDVDSSIVQMNFTDERLLVSTMTRCYLCDPKKGLTFQIGTKLRDGAYGACFLKTSGSEKPSIFCARPGSRIWEANTLCQVLHTHQFKQLLARPPLPVMGKGREVKFPSEDAKHAPQSLAFPILHPLGNHFLVTWNDHGVYVFDPVNVHVVFWTSDISGLVDVSVSKSSLYCLHQDGNIRKYTLQNIARCAASLYQQSLLVQCSRLVLRFQALFQRSRARHHMPPHVLHELAKRVAAEDSILGCEVEELAVSAENRVLDVPSTASSRRSSFDSYDGMRLQSGIYVVRKRPDSECSDDLPLGYDAHMEMQGNSEWTEKSREETIQETFHVNVELDSKEDSPTEDIKLEVDVSSCVEDVTVIPKDGTLIQENSAMEISKGGTGSRDPDLGDSTTHEQRKQEKDKSDALVSKEEDSDVSKENSPAGENMVVEENASTGEGLQEDVNKLDNHIAVTPRFAEKEISVHRLEADSNLLSMTSIAQSDDSSSHGIHKAFEEEPVEQEKVLKDQNALTSQLESGTGSHSLSLVSSFQNDVISTPNQDAFKKSEADHLEENLIQNDGNIDAADVQISHQRDHTAAEDHIGCRTNIDVPPLQEISTTADVIVNVGAPAVDDSPDQQSVSPRSNSPGQDVGEVETMQDELVIGGIGFDSPLMKHETKESRATEECQHVGLPEINQRKTLSNALDNSHSTETQVTSTSDLNMEVSGGKTDKEVALVYMQSHRDMDSEREISQREDEEGSVNFRNQKFVKDIVTNNRYETKELYSGENPDSLSEPCREDYRAGRESESQFQDHDLITQTGDDSLTTKHQHCSSEETPAGLLKLPTQTDESTPIDVSGFGLDVSGFGISPPEDSFHYPNQGEQNKDQSANAQQPVGYGRIPPEKIVDPTVLPKDLHKSSKIDHGYQSSASENKEDQMMMSYSGEKRSEDREIWAQQDSILASAESSTVDQHHSNVITKLASHYHSNQAEQANFHEEDCSNLLRSTLSSSNYAMDDSLIDTSSIAKSKDSASKSRSVMSDVAKVSQSLLSKEADSSTASSLENLEIVREDDLEVAEGDCQFPNAETELIKSVTESRYTQRVAEQRDRSMSLEKINQEPSGGNANAPSASSKRKKTKSRVIDITETVSRKPSPLDNMAPGSVLYRPTSLPDLSPQSSSQSYPLQRTPSSTIPSPALSPMKEARRPSPASSALPSPNLIIAATSGLPHSSGLMETQQIILSSTAQINLKAVKNSLTSKLSKTKTFLQSMGDSNPLSPKEGDHRIPPVQPRPSPSSSPISGSPTHRKGTPASNEISHLHSSSSPQPSLVSSPQHQPQGDFGDELVEEAKGDQVDSRLSEDLIEATNTALLVLRDPQTSFSPDAMGGVLQSWVNKLEQTYRSCQAEGITPWSKGHLPMTAREDVGCLAMQCFSMDIYANEERFRNSDEETAPDPGSLSERGEKEFSDSSELDKRRAAFIKRHFTILDRQRVLEVLQYKQGCHNSVLRILLQCEEDEAKNSNICEVLDNENVQEAFDLLFRANLTSSNLPLSLCFLRRLCSLDSGRALDMMISDYPTINPWHAYHILLHQPQFKFLLLDYVESSLMTHPSSQRKKFIEQVMSMKPLAVSLAEAALTFDPPNPSDLFCDCGELPKLGSHLIKWSHDQILDLILFSSSVPQDILLQLFLRAGYWHGAIILMARERGRLMDAIKLCIQLGDHALISSSQNNLIPSTEEEWRTVLEWMKKCQPSRTEENNSAERKCLNCGISLSVCNLTRPVASEELSEMVVEVKEQETDGLSPSSQPECDWSVTDPLEPGDQSGSLMETCACSKGAERSDAIDGDAENSENGNHQSEGIKDLSTPQESNLENPSTTPSPSALSDSDWLPTVTWQRIALLLVSHLGAVKGVKLLREVQVPEGMLGREFHQMCLYVSMWEKRQSLLSYAMLEGTDAYLWSKRQPLLGPRLQHLIMTEYQGVRQGCADTGSEGERMLKAQNLLSQDQLYIEDPGTHWGRTTNLGRICRVCHQSLAWSSVLHSAGCIIFPCGHVFHTLCVPEKACILCFYGNRGIKL